MAGKVEKERQDPFVALEDARKAYRRYVTSFQWFKNPTIGDWVDQNTIVATGTGSGKSFCFGIPVISERLRPTATSSPTST